MLHLGFIAAIRLVAIRAYWPLILFFALLSGCSGAGSDLQAFSPEKILGNSDNAEIRKAAVEDHSFPSASEPVQSAKQPGHS